MTDLELYGDERDRQFAEDRRAKAASRPCAACRQKAEAEKELAAKQKKQATPAHQAPATTPRLPDGSAFNVTYDATKKEWRGSLTVPGKGELTAAASGVFRLLRELEQQYLKSAGQTGG
jgi:hypothetical protein